MASGACIAVGDLFMQTAQAQLGVAVGPAIIFAVGIAGGRRPVSVVGVCFSAKESCPALHLHASNVQVIHGQHG